MLRIDRQRSPEVSLASWIPTIWMLIVASKPLGVWLDSRGSSVEEGSSLDRLFLGTLLCIGLFILAKRKFNWSSAVRKNFWLVVLLGYMLASCFISDIPFISFRRWIKEFIALVMAFVLASEPYPEKALESLFRRIIYICIPLSYVLIHYFAQYGRLYVHNEGLLMWTGVGLHKNSMGQLCLFAALFLIWSFNKRRLGRDAPAVQFQALFECFILILICMIMAGPNRSLTYSATSTATFVIGLMMLIWFSRGKQKRGIPNPIAVIAVVAVFIIYGTVTPLIGKLPLFDVAAFFGRSESMTGRDDIWAILVPMAMDKPLLGHGFGGFWTSSLRHTARVSQAHNGYLDTILSTGFFGLLVLSIFLLASGLKARRTMSSNLDGGVLQICFLLILVIHNIAETSIASFASFLFAVLIFQLVSIPEKKLNRNF